MTNSDYYYYTAHTVKGRSHYIIIMWVHRVSMGELFIFCSCCGCFWWLTLHFNSHHWRFPQYVLHLTAVVSQYISTLRKGDNVIISGGASVCHYLCCGIAIRKWKAILHPCDIGSRGPSGGTGNDTKDSVVCEHGDVGRIWERRKCMRRKSVSHKILCMTWIVLRKIRWTKLHWYTRK